MGRKILFITTDQQRYDSLGLQRRHDRAHAGGRRAGRDGRQLRARVQPEHGVHAGALDDAHRPVRAHARRGRQRRAAAGRRAERSPSTCASTPATAPRCSARRTSSPGFDFQLRSGPRTAWPERGLTGPYRGFEHAELAMHVPSVGKRAAAALRPVADRQPRHRGDEGLLAAARGRARRRDRRARDADQPDPARVVPHRLGRRSHDRVPRLAARRRRLVRVDVVPRPAPPVGSAASPSCTAATGATSTCRPGIPGSNEEIERVLAQKPAHWLALWEGTCDQRRRRAGHVPRRRTSATTTSARSTRWRTS